MEWIKAILDKHIGEDGVLNLEEAQKEISTEFPKNAVPKSEFNTKIDDLKTANDTINTLQQENKDVETLQTTINEYKDQITTLETERAEERKTYAIKEALQGAGASDVDYMMFKLGEVEVDEEGNIKDLENKIKELQESIPSHFGNIEPEGKKTEAPGYRVEERRLKPGSPQPPRTMEEIMEIKDSKERQQAIKDNGHLFK